MGLLSSTQGKTEQTILRESCRRIVNISRFGRLLFSLAGIGFLADLVANAGAIPWNEVHFTSPTTFYEWPEKVRWIIVLLLFWLLGGAILLACKSRFAKIECAKLPEFNKWTNMN